MTPAQEQLVKVAKLVTKQVPGSEWDLPFLDQMYIEVNGPSDWWLGYYSPCGNIKDWTVYVERNQDRCSKYKLRVSGDDPGTIAAAIIADAQGFLRWAKLLSGESKIARKEAA